MAGIEESLTQFPADLQNVPGGQYYFESSGASDVVTYNGTVRALDWPGFQTPALPDQLIKRIKHLQLITESKDHLVAQDPARGNWAWFELGIVRGSESNPNQANTEALCWMSHENAFMTNEFEWRDGRVFGTFNNDGLLRSLKNGDFIQVRLCSRYGSWGIRARKGYLIFDIENEGSASPADSDRWAWEQPRDTSTMFVAGADGAAEILRGYNRRLTITYQTLGSSGESNVSNLANWATDNQPEPSLLIINLNEPFSTSTVLRTLSALPQSFSFRPILVVVDAANLPWTTRGAGFLSWDQIVESFWTLQSTRGVDCPYHLLIRFGYEGAIYQDPNNQRHDPVLIFEPRSAEGDFLKKTRAENPTHQEEELEATVDAAFMAGLVASLAKESKRSIEELCETQIKEAVINGLLWCRRSVSPRARGASREQLWKKLILETAHDPVLIPSTPRRPQSNTKPRSSLIFQTLPYEPAAEAATEVVLKPDITGKEDLLPYVPIACFGNNFITADRREIEDFRDLARQVQAYVKQGSNARPFPIAVFGRPGSGKSFGASEVIGSLLPDGTSETLKFNLSQWQKVSDFKSALQKVKAVAENLLPVVYFDEFDASFKHQPLFWVRYFMEHLTSPTGKWPGSETGVLRGAIYVFIGGTAETFDEFQFQPSPRVRELMGGVGGGGGTEEGGRVAEAVRAGYPRSCIHLKKQIDDHFGPNTKLETIKFLDTATTYQRLVEVFRWVRDTDSANKTEANPATAKLPVVFFENFGASNGKEPLGWLKFFLSPMQDGEFFDPGVNEGEEGRVCKLGRAIFVFIEGDMGHFDGFLDYPDMLDLFKHAKGPDFVSRLSGQVDNHVINGDASADCLRNAFVRYKAGTSSKPLSIGVFRTDETSRKKFAGLMEARINVQGPNKVDDHDEMFVIRRAIMLRYMLKKGGLEGKLAPGSDVLNALLQVPRLRHGARSLETILAMSAIPAEGQTFVASHLPPDSQLKLHVDLESFKNFLEPTPQPEGEEGQERERGKLGAREWITMRRGSGFRRENLC